jgi:transposase
MTSTHLRHYPVPGAFRLETWTRLGQQAAVPTTRLATLLVRLSHGHFGAEKARTVKTTAQQSIGVRRASEALAFALQLLLRQIRDLERLVTDLDQEIGRCYSSLDRYLRTIPGVGAATAPAIYAEVGDIRCFTDSDQLVALVGVDPPAP